MHKISTAALLLIFSFFFFFTSRNWKIKINESKTIFFVFRSSSSLFLVKSNEIDRVYRECIFICIYTIHNARAHRMVNDWLFAQTLLFSLQFLSKVASLSPSLSLFLCCSDSKESSFDELEIKTESRSDRIFFLQWSKTRRPKENCGHHFFRSKPILAPIL